jgi:glyoxylase-like metal-dependent hydrolase (beta-lactamase superfamily II)/ferredoxin
MASREQAVPGNMPGPFFVDATCIDCDTCRQLAPATFGDNGETSFVRLQPRDDEERRAVAGEHPFERISLQQPDRFDLLPPRVPADVARAVVACPTGSIGGAAAQDAKTAADEFPLPIDNGVSYCGFNSRKSFGGNSYFVEHPGGNWLVDSPRFVERLARRFAERGGIRHIFLTHRDDVADAGQYAARFGAERIIHRLERSAQPDAERLIDGFDPIALAPDFIAIPTPGHTRGHCALLYRGRFLFSGDHIWWSRVRGRLTASRDVCWHSWREQVESVRLLERYSFEWVLPGHGERAYFPREEMRRQVGRLVEAVRAA